MKPSVGRIVHYVLPSGQVGAHRPAIVVHVWPGGSGNPYPDGETVQLQVFMDGSNDWYFTSIHWATSVTHDEGKAPGTWHWPESE